ncbi:MAG: ACT domain-containing protein [Clostridia bacterium]|nr:ACT domain-containing protein [Clostridia bacterium]
MSIKQISVFVENRHGALTDVCSVLAENGISMHALSLADTQDFGILRVIVEDPEKAAEILRSSGYPCKLTPVIAVRMEDKPGGMAAVMKLISDAGIGVEYAYAFLSHTPGKAYMVFRIEGSESRRKLSDMGLDIVSSEELFR